MRRFALCLLLASCALAQKKPITLDSLNQAGRGGRGHGAAMPALWTPDGSRFILRQGRGLAIYDPATRSSKPLITAGAVSSAAAAPASGDTPFEWRNRNAGVPAGGLEFSENGKELLYPSGGDLFLVHMDTASVDQLTKTPEHETDPRLSPDGKTVAFHRGWDLYTIDVASKTETRLTRDGSTTLRNGAPDWVYPEEIGLSTGFWWSPDSHSIAYLQFDSSREPIYPHEDLLHLRSIYEPERYPQAGDNNAVIHLGVVPSSGGPTRWFDIGDTRDAYLIARVGWMPGSRALYVVRTNRVQNHLEFFTIDVESGRHTTVLEESDPYWINPGSEPLFLHDGRRFLWTSERSQGFRHIFLYSNDGSEVHQLTSGAWEVTAIDGVDEGAGRVFYTSTEPTHLERQLYSVGLDGAGKRRLTPEPGTHTIAMAPNGKYYIDTWSSLTDPPRSVLHSGDGVQLAVYREPDRSAMEEFDILPTEIVQFKGPGGETLYGRLIKPAGFQPGKRYPVVVDVYGGPGVALPVHNSWSGIGIDQVLAYKGYIVWQCENRGGTGRGHAFETAIYHHLGSAELADQVAGVQHLISLGIADPDRVAIHGWSYGGFMTVNALLNAPDVFKAGFAGAPVTSWMNYDTIYTERYMGLPKENPDGYRDTALPAKAQNLKGRLMLVHNFEDDNVLFQNSLQLTNALQLAGKQFEFMLYPQKTHGVTGAATRQMNQMMLDFFDRALSEPSPKAAP